MICLLERERHTQHVKSCWSRIQLIVGVQPNPYLYSWLTTARVAQCSRTVAELHVAQFAVILTSELSVLSAWSMLGIKWITVPCYFVQIEHHTYDTSLDLISGWDMCTPKLLTATQVIE